MVRKRGRNYYLRARTRGRRVEICRESVRVMLWKVLGLRERFV